MKATLAILFFFVLMTPVFAETDGEKEIFVTFREVELPEEIPDDFAFTFLADPSGGIKINPLKEPFRAIGTFASALSKNKSRDGRVQPVVSGVFTDPQFQMLLRALEEKESLRPHSNPSSISTTSGTAGIARIGHRSYGVLPKLMSDGETIDLVVVSFPESRDGFDLSTHEFPTAPMVTLWAGQTVSFLQEENAGRKRIIFATAELKAGER